MLSLVTCGFYSIYLVATLHVESSSALGEENSVGTNILLSFVTCGIWSIVLSYQTAQNYLSISQSKGVTTVKDNTMLVLILYLLGFGLVSLAILQDQQNKLIDTPSNNEGEVL